jgi:hypothetical protein
MIRQLRRSLHRQGHWWFAGLLIVLTLGIYSSSLHFGLIWDDPIYYQRVLAQSSLWQILSSPQPPTFQFYRPLAVICAHLVISPAGVVNAPLAHWLQISAHLIATLAVAPVLQAFKLRPAPARLAALFFALSPLSYYGVAWQQNQQPLMLMGVLVALLAAQQFCQRRTWPWLALSLLAYASALLIQEGAAPFVFAFVWLGLINRGTVFAKYKRWWPLLHLGVVALYALIWLSMPLQRGVTGHGFQPVVLAYLEQGLVFPLAAALTPWIGSVSTWGLVGLFTLLWALLSVGVWKWISLEAALFGNVWVAAGLAPLWAGLSWDYAQNGARLVYPATLGIALVWGGWLSLVFAGQRRKQLLGGLVCAGVAVSALWQLGQSQQMYQIGTQHLAQAVNQLSANALSSQRLLFVNFPDRIEMRSRPYPLGFWGVYLAPVIQNLSDYALAATGQSAQSDSLAAFLIGADDRTQWPYQVAMRGIDTDPAAFFEAARRFDAVYLTQYLPDGSLRLVEAGEIRASTGGRPPLARFGEAIQLIQADLLPTGELRLTWRCLRPLGPDDTIFVHLWQGEAFAASADGDSLSGLVSPATWQAGTDIVDIRSIHPGTLEPGTYDVRVGFYNRVTGTRYPALAPGGTAFSDEEVRVGQYTR